ncbi:uncharacterized protein K441DRAFT_717655, partial [Cenococcum geophilum 1.58]|uniref:uncharacterized protein n=1 Tax=Cenococcum geophilum 1.58 TaxID=794803 RepID=UPI00358E19A4
PNKSPAGVLILFILKLDETIRLYVDYYGLNKIIIKNCYLLLLVRRRSLRSWIYKTPTIGSVLKKGISKRPLLRPNIATLSIW